MYNKQECYSGKLGRRRVDGWGCVRCLVKAVQGKEVGRDVVALTVKAAREAEGTSFESKR
jgi:hypothetical protein